VKDSTGQVVEKFSQDSPFEIPEQNLAKAQSSSITLSHAVFLPPGHYTIDAAVLDEESRRASTSKIEFDSPTRNGVAISSILLVQGVEQVNGKVDPSNPLEFQANPTQGQRVVPDVASHISANGKPYAYFVVYPDPSIAEKAKIQAEFWVGGSLMAKQVADLPAPDATGAIPMVINTAAKPGTCELRITALQGASTAKQSLTYSVTSK